MAGSPDQVHVRSPFPPIADYGFLSDCESAALVAPSGNVEWLCLPRMDSPSVFGAMLDRGAGGFRLGPADMTVPAARRYLPGTMVLETSWGTPTGWIIVRDAAADRPLAPRGRAVQHPPARADRLRRRPRAAAHRALRQRRGADRRWTASRCSTTAARLRRWRYTDDGLPPGPRRRATASSSSVRLTTDMRLGFEGPRATARTLLKEGEHALRRAVVERARAAARPSTRPTGGWSGPRTTGSTGWPAAGSPTTRGAATSSAAR